MPELNAKPDPEALRIIQSQVDRLERKINELNADLAPLQFFRSPGRIAAALHLARAVTRRAERVLVAMANEPGEMVGEPALKYVNRLSDFLLVAARYVNRKGESDILWVPGQNQRVRRLALIRLLRIANSGKILKPRAIIATAEVRKPLRPSGLREFKKDSAFEECSAHWPMWAIHLEGAQRG